MTTTPAHFIRNIIESDLKNDKIINKIITRFPPEPNGYLHIGHLKAICLNFNMAKEFNGHCNLRFDDTNPEKENEEYMQAIKKDIEWLGFNWQNLYHASDYFEQLLDYAYQLIDKNLAYVDSQSVEEIHQTRGTLTEKGINSPYRNRTIKENRDLFDRMVAGDFADGACVLRAKIDMASPNINMRDPVIYRIRHRNHFHTGDKWKVYPMYDYTHCLSDMLENITHSLCTLEFEAHRPLYNWFLEALNTPCHPKQIEFARLNLEYTVLSKRWLVKLVEEKIVNGWDDPRLPTIAGLRRRGITPTALKDFCDRIGVSKADSMVEISYLENIVREELNQNCLRKMAVLNPLKIIITNLEQEQQLTIPNHPQRPELGNRTLSFTQEIYIEKEDFSEEPPKKWKRLAKNQAVRLRGGYVIICDEVIKNQEGEIIELKCHFDPQTLGKNPENYKANGVIHWVSSKDAIPAEIRLYDHLFLEKNPLIYDDFYQTINPNSLIILKTALVEKDIENHPNTVYQFERQGYFAIDDDSKNDYLVFNRTISLKDGRKE